MKELRERLKTYKWQCWSTSSLQARDWVSYKEMHSARVVAYCLDTASQGQRRSNLSGSRISSLKRLRKIG